MWMKRESEDESASAAHQEKGKMPRYGLECFRGTREKICQEKMVEKKDLMCAVQCSVVGKLVKQSNNTSQEKTGGSWRGTNKGWRAVQRPPQRRATDLLGTRMPSPKSPAC